MNCCDEYGDCRQSDDCPARTGLVLPHQARHACKVAGIKANPVPPEAGNVQFDADGVPLSYAETMELVRLMIYLLLGVIVFFGGLSLAVNYSTELWADVLWAYLAALS